MHKLPNKKENIIYTTFEKCGNKISKLKDKFGEIKDNLFKASSTITIFIPSCCTNVK